MKHEIQIFEDTIERHIYEVRYLFKRGNYLGAYAPRVKTFYEREKALTWANKHCDKYCIIEFAYEANRAKYCVANVVFGG